MRRILNPGLALVVLPALGAALDATAFRAGPTFVSYTVAGQTTSQIAIPMVAVIPLGQRLTVDVATAFASTQATSSGASSTISGLTDTQLRANYALPGDQVVLTLGLNIPTGASAISGTQLAAAQAIGIDFYTYPVPAYGSGFAATMGAAYAGTAGDWEWGAGASYRKSAGFEPQTGSVTFTPGDEFRMRLGGQTPVGSGRIALGLIFSAFGSPKYDTTTVSTGARAIAQAVYTQPIGSNELFITLWNLYTGAGRLLAGPSQAANITNLGLAFGIHQGNITWEPNVEGRFISQGGITGNLVFPGLRVRIPAGNWTIYPGASGAFGSVQSQTVSGFRATLGIHFTP